MIKLKATKKEMKEHYFHILSVGYCSMQSLLNEQRPLAYSAGTKGWACDYYEVECVLISTGYAPLPSRNMTEDYSVIEEYENKSLKIDEISLPYIERREKKAVLLKELIEKLKE